MSWNTQSWNALRLNSNYSRRARIFMVAFIFSCSTIVAYAHTRVFAETKELINPKKLTRDLDQKNAALADEEAKLMASMTSNKGKKSAPVVAETLVKEPKEPRASIDLKKVADTIVRSDSPAPTTVKELTVETTKIEEQAEPAPRAKKAEPAVVKQEIVREVIKETGESPELRGEVTAMGNLFNQWQQDFEKKHSEVLDSQQKLERSLNARMDQVESLTRGDDGGQSEMITELMKEQGSLDARIVALEKSERPAAPANSKDAEKKESTKKLEKEYAELQTALLAQEKTLKSLQLVDGQVKHRLNSAEADMSNAHRDMDSIQQSVTRIETNLNELSEQFLDSLKYRPHVVYDATEKWTDDYEYDWNNPDPQYSVLPHNAVMSNMPMVTVTEEIANLWSGPGEDDKIVTTIRRGAQLAVEAKEHDWYRVIVADGRRAWIPARAVIHNNPTGKNTALRIASAE